MSYYPKRRKNRWRSSQVTLLTCRLLAVLFLLSFSRWFIYMFNMHFFQNLTIGGAVRLYFVGLRFDLVVLAYLNIPMIFYYLFPSVRLHGKGMQRLIDFIYVVFNSLAISLNLIDVVYFRFIGKRMTSEITQFFGNIYENTGVTLRHILVNYWYMALLIVLFVSVLIVVARWTTIKKNNAPVTQQWYLRNAFAFIIFSILTLIACRGGLREKPISMATALRYTNPQNAPIVLNTPFSIVKGAKTQTLKEIHLVEDPTFSPIHEDIVANRFITENDSIPDNVVLIILENFGQEMIGYYNPQRRFQLTPFLDSLLNNSLTFSGMANGRRSIESLPSILSGLPSLMDLDYINSPYSHNDLSSFGKNLKNHGYQTSFFHGEDKGSLGIAGFVHNVGFDNYFRSEKHGKQGVFDKTRYIFARHFLQDACKAIDTMPQPFATVLYIFSPQHPFTSPKDIELPHESHLWTDFELSVYCCDYALREFFTEAQKEDWYDNTLFVITADHANTEHFLPQYSNIWGIYKVPVAFFEPSRIQARKVDEIAQQTDLNVSILSALGINDTIFSFGRNLFDSTSNPCHVSYINQTYQYSDGHFLIQSDGTNPLGIFNITSGDIINDNLLDRIQCPDLYRKLSEQLQEYNNSMINNNLTVEKYRISHPTKDTISNQSQSTQLEVIK